MNRIDSHGPDDELASLLVDFETQLAAGRLSTCRPRDAESRIDASTLERLEQAQECVLLLEEIWPHSRPFAGRVPERIGRFRVLRELGRGGFGIVYLVRDEKLSRQIALKVQRPETILSGELRERFLREAKAAARLDHPHIAGVHELGEEGMQIWIANEYVPGSTLASWMREQRELVEPRVAATFTAALADAVEFAHQRGVLHRDLKPSNVLLDAVVEGDTGDSRLEAFRPKLIDFGLAKLDEAPQFETRSGAFVGTPAYMSPEQAAGNTRQISAATDVYGLGTILYELLCGKPAFAGPNDVQILRQVIEEEPPRPRQMRRAVPPDLEAIVLKCLEKSPTNRYPSAGALAADLRRFLAGQPTVARPVSRSKRLLKWTRRHPALAGLLAVTHVAAAAMVAMSAVYISNLRAANQEAQSSAREARRQTAVANQFLYASRMRAAYQAIDQGELELADESLSYYRPGRPMANLRGFEWYHLKRRLHSERVTLAGHQGEVYAVAFSPDGKRVVSGGDDRTIRVWDADGGRLLQTVLAHDSCVNAVVFSPDGSLVASGSCDHRVKLWDPETFTPVATLEGHRDEVHSVAFNPTDPNRLASGGHDSFVLLWDLTSLHPVRMIEVPEEVNGLCWTADGQTLLRTGDANPAELGGTDLDTVNPSLVECQPGAMSVATSPRGDAVWGLENTVMRSRNGDRTQPIALTGHLGHVDSIAYSPRGDRFASGGSDRTIRIWDAETNACMQVHSGHRGRVQALAFSRDGMQLASASLDGTVKLWGDEPADRTTRVADICLPPVPQIAIDDDCRYAAMLAEPGSVEVHRLDSGTGLGRLHLLGVPSGLQFLPGRPVLFGAAASVQGMIDEWDVENWKSLATRPIPPGSLHSLRRWGPWLVAERDDATDFLDLASGQQRYRIPNPPGDDRRIHPSGSLASVDGSAFLVQRIAAGRPGWLLRPSAEPTPVEMPMRDYRAVSNDGKLAAWAVGPYAIQVGEPAALTSTTLRHPEPIGAVVFTPDGKTVATTSGDRTVLLWNLPTGQIVGSLTTRPGRMVALQFSTDGRRLAVIVAHDLEFIGHVPFDYANGTRLGAYDLGRASILVWSGISGDGDGPRDPAATALVADGPRHGRKIQRPRADQESRDFTPAP